MRARAEGLLGDDELSDEAQGAVRGGLDTSRLGVPLPGQLGLNASKLHLMQEALFGNTNAVWGGDDSFMGGAFELVDDEALPQPEMFPQFSPIRAADQSVAAFPLPGPGPLTRGVREAPKRGYEFGVYARSVAREGEMEGVRAVRDSGLCSRRAFRVGWGPGGQLVHMFGDTGVVIKKVDIRNPPMVQLGGGVEGDEPKEGEDDGEDYVSLVVRSLGVHLDHTRECIAQQQQQQQQGGSMAMKDTAHAHDMLISDAVAMVEPDMEKATTLCHRYIASLRDFANHKVTLSLALAPPFPSTVSPPPKHKHTHTHTHNSHHPTSFSPPHLPHTSFHSSSLRWEAAPRVPLCSPTDLPNSGSLCWCSGPCPMAHI